MLIDFRIKNFRSLRDEQILSLEAAGGRSEHAGALRQPDGLAKGMRLLPVVTLFGPNASGKTNLFRALMTMRGMVLRSFAQSDDERGPIHEFVPFALDPAHRDQPVALEVTFIAAGVRYRYGFAVLDQTVVSEFLFTWPKGKQVLIFSRGLANGEGGPVFKCNETIEGGKERAHFVAEQTHPQALFLSTAQKLNHPAVKIIHQWFHDNFRFLDHTRPSALHFMAKNFIENADVRSWTNRLMQWADLGIEEMQVDERQLDSDLESSFRRLKTTQSLRAMLELRHSITALHRASDGSMVSLDLNSEESHGTERMFGLAGPLWDVLRHGRTLFVDELTTGFHHWMVRQLVSLFQNPETNPHNAQLIFTSHDPLLLDLSLMRRDQFYFVKKDSAGGSELYSLADVKTTEGARKDAVQLHKKYLSGAFGAIPHLGSLNDLTLTIGNE